MNRLSRHDYLGLGRVGRLRVATSSVVVPVVVLQQQSFGLIHRQRSSGHQ